MSREIPGVPFGNKSTDENPVRHPINPHKDQELQKRYLTHDSVYLCLQNNLIRLIKLIKPKTILELGFGGSQTAVKVAKKYPNIKITIVNSDNGMKSLANKEVQERNINNITISEYSDVTKFIENGLSDYDFIYLLYNFHHIPDTTARKKEKIDFLADCYDNMKSGSYFCIADDFLPEMCNENELKKDDSLENLYDRRAEETKTLTFWTYLNGVTHKDVRKASEEADNSKIREKESFVKVKTQDGEYLIKKSWLVKIAKDAGFEKIIDEDVNSIGDAILLFKK